MKWWLLKTRQPSDWQNRWASLVALLMICLLTATPGCQWFRFKKPKPDPVRFRLPPIKLSENTIALEIGILEIEDSQEGILRSLWGQLDDQVIELNQRKIWDQNGLQAAVVPNQPPVLFWKLLDPEKEYSSEDERFYQEKLRKSQGLPEQKNVVLFQKANLILGKSHSVPAGPVFHDGVDWQLNLGDERQSGHCKQAQFHFRLMVFRQANNQVRLRLTPEIQHGEKRPRISVNEESFVWEPSKESLAFHETEMEVPLKSGQTVLCGPCFEEVGLGQLFLRSKDKRRFLFVRVISVGPESLFSLPDESAPIATPLD